jgi:hypothetical protein
MATENIVLLACAAALVTLHLVGGPLSGAWAPSKKRHARGERTPATEDDASMDPEEAKADSSMRRVA